MYCEIINEEPTKPKEISVENMNDEIQVKLTTLIDLQERLKLEANGLQNLLIPYFGTNNPVIWANKLSKDELESMRNDNSRAYAMWGQDEENVLVEMHEAGIEIFVISQALGRTESSVRGKLSRISST
jgi:hypothetical protein